MAKESLQRAKGRVRPPRVQIQYDVYIGDALKMKELPFVVGVLGDFSGKPKKTPPKMADRKFVPMDRDNFNSVLAGMAPRLAFQVDDKLSGKKDSMLNVELNINSMADFSPENVVKQIAPLRKLLEKRDKYKNLLGKMEGNDELERLLEKVLKDTETREKLRNRFGSDASNPEGSAPNPADSTESNEPSA